MSTKTQLVFCNCNMCPRTTLNERKNKVHTYSCYTIYSMVSKQPAYCNSQIYQVKSYLFAFLVYKCIKNLLKYFSYKWVFNIFLQWKVIVLKNACISALYMSYVVVLLTFITMKILSNLGEKRVLRFTARISFFLLYSVQNRFRHNSPLGWSGDSHARMTLCPGGMQEKSSKHTWPGICLVLLVHMQAYVYWEKYH